MVILKEDLKVEKDGEERKSMEEKDETKDARGKKGGKESVRGAQREKGRKEGKANDQKGKEMLRERGRGKLLERGRRQRAMGECRKQVRADYVWMYETITKRQRDRQGNRYRQTHGWIDGGR